MRYQSKCKLIKGWDDLFAKVDEDLNNLSSMKISPYYKSFEEEIMPWDDKLQKVKILFDLFFLFFSLYLFLFAAVGSMSSAGGSISKASFSAPPISSSSWPTNTTDLRGSIQSSSPWWKKWLQGPTLWMSLQSKVLLLSYFALTTKRALADIGKTRRHACKDLKGVGRLFGDAAYSVCPVLLHWGWGPAWNYWEQ